RVLSRWFRAADSITENSAPSAINSNSSSCYATELAARDGTKENVDERSAASRFHPRWPKSKLCGFWGCSNNAEWNFSFNSVNCSGAKLPSTNWRIWRLISRALVSDSAVTRGAQWAVE